MAEINDVINLLNDISEDSTTSKNVKEKMGKIVGILENGDENSIKVNKALDELDDAVNDNNMQQFTRTQIWNVVSLLENF
jgi:uncharacterized protein (UPF0147 family)|tara:strand:+ start:1180 stop:1419 length:240 start_codon:yes stop_codon:yes gene_type:complete